MFCRAAAVGLLAAAAACAPRGPVVDTAARPAGVGGTIAGNVHATGGAPLSEGQKQAIMMARAIIGAPTLLIVDEALDSVQDSDERDLLTNLLFAPDAPWTLLIVSARPDLLSRCDRIIDITAGDLDPRL